MNREDILRIVEEDGYTVFTVHKTAVNVNNSGTLNEEKLKKEKKLVFRNITEYLVDELITENQHYPHDDISEVDMEADFIIFKREDYDKIKEYLEYE